MSVLDDTCCGICERIITKEQWNKHLFSSTHSHRVVNAYLPAYSPQRKLTSDEVVYLRKFFGK